MQRSVTYISGIKCKRCANKYKKGQFLEEYRTFCRSPKAEITLEMFELIPVLAT